MAANAYICTIEFKSTPTIMKKLTSITAALLMAMASLTLTSCDDDEGIANTLWGVWEGQMASYYSHGGTSYSVTYSVISFDKDPYYSASGTGYWIDYFDNSGYQYYATHIEWVVRNRNIYIESIEDGDEWVIYDYELYDDRFTGHINNDSGSQMSFSLYKTSAPDLYDYEWGWDNSTYYYNAINPSETTRSTETDGTKPVRHFGTSLATEHK